MAWRLIATIAALYANRCPGIEQRCLCAAKVKPCHIRSPRRHNTVMHTPQEQFESHRAKLTGEPLDGLFLQSGTHPARSPAAKFLLSGFIFRGEDGSPLSDNYPDRQQSRVRKLL